jgi:hypothetical protein
MGTKWFGVQVPHGLEVIAVLVHIMLILVLGCHTVLALKTVLSTLKGRS